MILPGLILLFGRAKEFADCPTESKQIAHLKRLLADLGMTGKMSLERAKTIREKRELKQEIGAYA